MLKTMMKVKALLQGLIRVFRGDMTPRNDAACISSMSLFQTLTFSIYSAWVITAQPSLIQMLYVQIASSPPPVELAEFLKGLMNDSFPLFSDSFESLYLDWGEYEEKGGIFFNFCSKFFPALSDPRSENFQLRNHLSPLFGT